MPRSKPHFFGSVYSIQKGIYNSNGVRTWTELNKWQDEGRGAYLNGKEPTRFTKVLRRSPSVINIVLAFVHKQKQGRLLAARRGTGS